MFGQVFNRRRRGFKPRRAALNAPEQLESRQVLSRTPLGTSLSLGFSPPDLTVIGRAPVVAAYGGTIGVSVDVVNLGANAITDPLALQQGATSLTDAPPSVVGVYLSTNPRRLAPGALRIGQIPTPSVQQNSVVTLDQNLFMPATRPPGFPQNGNRLYVYFRADDLNQAFDLNRGNNITRAPEPVQLAAPLPELTALRLETPPVLQPGDFINPSIRVANLGTTHIPPQGPLLVQLVASTDEFFGPTDVLLASYTINDIPPLSEIPTRGATVLDGLANIDDPANIITLIGPQVQLPAGTAGYFLGVAVDPVDAVREISEIGIGPDARFDAIARVGGPIAGLPPAGVIGEASSGQNVFPIPPFGPLPFINQPTGIFDFVTAPPLVITQGGGGLGALAARRANLAAARSARFGR